MSINKLLPLAEAAQRYAGDGIQYASGAGLPVGADAIAFATDKVDLKKEIRVASLITAGTWVDGAAGGEDERRAEPVSTCGEFDDERAGGGGLQRAQLP